MERFRRWLNPSGQGAWLFRQHRLAWTYEPSLRRQLPPLYRLLALYFKLTARLPGGDKVPLGEKALSLVSYLSRRFSPIHGWELAVEDFTVCLDLSDPRFLQVVNELRPGHPVGSLLGSLLRPGDTFVDVGANHGSLSLVAGRAVGPTGRLIAIEPNPRLAALISRSLKLSAPCPFQVLEVACGDEEGQADLFIPRASSGVAGLFRAFSAAGPHRRVTVQIRRFDDALDWRDLPGHVVLKVDVEGSEYAFLKGAAEMIRGRRPTLLIEINPTSLQAAEVDPGDLVELLHCLGYQHYFNLAEPPVSRPMSDLDVRREQNVVLRPALTAGD